jgi:hypothetical protein
VKHSFQVRYHHAITRAAGVVLVPNAAKAAEEKARLERLGFVATIVPPDEPEPAGNAP